VTSPAAELDTTELLRREIGGDRVIGYGDERLIDYGRDESGLGHYPPDCAVLCRDRDEVAAVLQVAAAHRIPVTPRGAGSGKVGGCLPIRGGVVLSTEPMGRILEIDTDDLVAVVEPGVITGELQRAVEAEGLFYPPDPASLAFCSIGGNVATNAGGPRAFKYGVTREYILGLEVALMGGELLRCGRRTSKGVSGYDLVAGFVGSEGTFGVNTEITIKLLPNPAAVETLLAVFTDLAAAGAAVSTLIARGFRPRTFEIADKVAVDHVRPHASYQFPRGAGAVLLIELDGDPEGLEAALIRAGLSCEDVGALEVIVAQGEVERRKLWEARRIISKCLTLAHPNKVSEDICVPRGALPEMLSRIDAIAARHDLPMACYGHAGDGNLHVNLLCDDDPADPAVRANLESSLEALFADTVALRGTLSGEHGIGLTKRRFMGIEHSERALEWQRKLKRLWDPEELLNPGKLLPERPAICTE
jgi:glycolate oxidase